MANTQERHTEMRSFYPRPFMNWGAMESTESVAVVSGSLTVGNVYFISKSGDDTTSFEGSASNAYGDIFTATGTTAVFGGAELVDVTAGLPTKIGYFYGHPSTLQFIWNLGYNSEGDCIFTTVTNPDGSQFDR